MQKIAIYTCITGGYDTLRQPAPAPDGFDFICFRGKGEKSAEREGAWEIRELSCGGATPTLASRYAKTHPHELLPEYD